MPEGGKWLEIVNSDAGIFGGSNQGNLGGMPTDPVPAHGHQQSLLLTLPHLGGVMERLFTDGLQMMQQVLLKR